VFISTDDEVFSSPFCLEFDPNSRNLIVGNLMQSFIELINVDNRQRSLLYSNSQNETGVGYPLMISVNSIDNEIYWLDEGLGVVPRKLASVRMDGTNPRILVQTELTHLSAIFFHAKTKKVFWSDLGRKRIESISVDGTQDRTVVLNDVEYPYALTIWDTIATGESILYYSDQIREQLVAFNLKSSEKRIIKQNVGDIMQLKIYQKFQSLNDNNNACLLNNGGCHQICIPTINNNRICKCSNGLQLQQDGLSCRPFQSFLLFTSDKYIRALPLLTSSNIINNELEALPVLAGNNIGKIDFDYKSRSILWIEDEKLVKIMKLNFSWQSTPNLNKTTDFLSKQVLFELDSSTGNLLSLTLDWINNLLFYSYYDSPNNYIKVTNFPQVEYHYTIFTSKVDKPSSMAVNPKLKYLYWIDEGQFAKLERSLLNGSNRTVLIKTDITSPTDIYVDVSTGNVYWSDNTKDRIERCDWQGQNRMIIKGNNLPNTKSLFVLDNILYYADARMKGIYSFNITSNLTLLLKQVKISGLNELILFNDKSQPNNIDSACLGRQCDQICLPLPGSMSSQCVCSYGDLDSNGQTCKTPKEYLIYSMESEIRSLNMPNNNANNNIGSPWKPLTGLGKAIGIDFDYRDNKIIFTDIINKKISWFTVTNENQVVEDVIQQNASLSRQLVQQPEGVAYDWVTDTIYYTDNGLNQIISYKISTRMRYVIAYSESPRAIVVHSCKGYLFWTDVGRSPMIVRSSLSGSNYQRIITTDIRWPNGLTIDFNEEKLYWADAYLNKIERTDFNGNSRQILSTALHPFAITVHNHFIYWTDWQTKSIYRAEKYRGSNTIQLAQGLPERPMDIHVWSDQRQKCTYNPCMIYNGGCSHICSVLAPGNRTECRCPFGMGLRLANNDRTCSPILMPRCNSSQFTCANGNCISKRFVCDGIQHCSDQSDESVNFCSLYTCQPSEFRCNNGRCIPYPERCDRVNSCGDNSDETGCVYPTCSENEFQCRNFKCIPSQNRCNGVIDCQDGNSTDEVGCPPITCNSTIYDVKCPNTNVCIMRRWLCDGDNDCGDAADENQLFCRSIPCSSSQFRWFI